MRAFLSLLLAAGCAGSVSDQPPGTGDAAQDPDDMVAACEPERCAGCALPDLGGELVTASDIPPRSAPAPVTPEPPLIHHTLRIAGGAGAYLAPSIPAHRTSFDARIAVIRGDA